MQNPNLNLVIKKLRVKNLNLKDKTSKYTNINLEELNLKQIPSYSSIKDSEIIKRYYSTCLKNKKQPQSSNKKSGRQDVTKPSGTNRGRSRIPRATNRSKVVNVPSAVGGGKAQPYSINQKSIKMNKKEKQLAIKLMIYYCLKKSPIYLINQDSTEIKDSLFLKFLKETTNISFNKFLEDPIKKRITFKKYYRKGPLLILENKEDTLIKRFKNFSSVSILTNKNKNYVGLLNGYRYPFAILTTLEDLKKFLKRIFSND